MTDTRLLRLTTRVDDVITCVIIRADAILAIEPLLREAVGTRIRLGPGRNDTITVGDSFDEVLRAWLRALAASDTPPPDDDRPL